MGASEDSYVEDEGVNLKLLTSLSYKVCSRKVWKEREFEFSVVKVRRGLVKTGEKFVDLYSRFKA